jgi:hypothetical protein
VLENWRVAVAVATVDLHEQQDEGHALYEDPFQEFYKRRCI